MSVIHRRVGVAKTTTVWNTAHELYRLGHKVLVVDADGQAELTRMAGFSTYTLTETLDSVLLGETPIRRAIRARIGDPLPPSARRAESTRARLDLLPSSHRLEDDVLPELIRCDARPDLLRWTLSSVRHDYDFVLIDSPQAMSLLTRNVLAAADLVLVPMATGRGEYAEEELHEILGTCVRYRSDLAPDRLWVLPTRYKRRSIRHQRTLRRLRENLPQHSKLLGPVHFSSWVETAGRSGKSIREIHDGLEATESYRQLALALSGLTDRPIEDDPNDDLLYWSLT